MSVLHKQRKHVIYYQAHHFGHNHQALMTIVVFRDIWGTSPRLSTRS